MIEVSKDDIRKWCEALRSGKYQQGRQLLESEAGFCCLGVACKVFIPEEKQEVSATSGRLHGGIPPSQPNAPEWLKSISDDFYHITGTRLTALNDEVQLTFDEIADLLEAVYIHEVLA